MKTLINTTILLFLTISCLSQPNTLNNNKELFASVRAKNFEKTRVLINSKNINAYDSVGVSLLSCAVLAKNFEVVKLLIEKGANPSLRNKTKSKSTPLMMCANYNLIAMASYLIKNGADIDIQDSNGDAVINWAAYMGAYSFVKLLLDSGAKTNQKSIHSDNVMGVALKEWQDSIVDLLISYDKGIHKVKKKQHLLIAAVKKNDTVFVKEHLNSINSNSRDEAGNTLLIIAATKDYDRITRLLVKNNAEVNAINPVGHTALNKTIFFKRNNIAKYLLKQGASVNKADNRFVLTPLIAAARSNNLEMGAILLKKGANVNVTNGIDNYSPIMWAVAYGNIDFVKLILKYNPDLTVVSKYGRDVFKMTRNDELLKLLKEKEN